jgi:hypothetical protein
MNLEHHFGLKRGATLGEQLILQDSVTHSINELPLLSEACGGAAALAAGDKFLIEYCANCSVAMTRSADTI